MDLEKECLLKTVERFWLAEEQKADTGYLIRLALREDLFCYFGTTSFGGLYFFIFWVFFDSKKPGL